MIRGYHFTHAPVVDAVGGDPTTGTLWCDDFETQQDVLLNQELQKIDADVSALFDMSGVEGVDSLTYAYTDAATLTVSPGVAVSQDGTRSYTVYSPTDVDITGLGAHVLGYLWIGEDSLSGDTVLRVNDDFTNPPANTLHARRLRWFFTTDGDGNLERFDAPIDAGRGLYAAYSGHYRPVNALVSDGAAYARAGLFAQLYAIVGNAGDLEFTANAGTNVITSPSHGLSDDDQIDFHAIDGALPSGLSAGTTYYVINKTDDTFQVSLSLGGGVHALGSAATGRCTVAPVESFTLVDMRGRAILGAGQGSGLTLRRRGASVGAETVSLSTAQLATHGHTITHTHTGPSHTHTGPSHTHTITHTHTGPSHTHTMAHTHTGGAHTHGLRGNRQATGSAWKITFCSSDNGVSGDGPTESGGNVTTSGSSAANTGSDGTGNTGGSSAANTGSGGTGNTDSGGTGNTGGSSAANTGNQGSGTAHNNMQPSVAAMIVIPF